jgi:hypothetical protein
LLLFDRWTPTTRGALKLIIVFTPAHRRSAWTIVDGTAFSVYVKRPNNPMSLCPDIEKQEIIGRVRSMD